MTKRLDDSPLCQQLYRLTKGARNAETARRGIEVLAKTHPHSVRLVSAATWRRETWAFNCHTYALGLQGRVTRRPYPARVHAPSHRHDADGDRRPARRRPRRVLQ